MIVRTSGMNMDVKPVQLENVPFPMKLTLLGMDINVITLLQMEVKLLFTLT